VPAHVPLAFSPNIESADWIRPRLSPFEECGITSIVPNGFDAYARILHPAQLPVDGRPLVRWSEVARWSGVPMGNLVQWHDIALPQFTPSLEPPWHGQGPREGSPYASDVDALIDDLADYTADSERCFFCVWVGYLGGSVAVFTPLGAPPVAPPRRDSPERVVALPHREYGLIEAPLSFAASLDALSDGSHKTANLWWPEDRAWCVASGIDLRWTYVGGSSELIARILSDERMEALPATPNDRSAVVVGGWLADVIETATGELMSTGSLKLELALGSVEMTWRDDKLRRRYVITSSTSGRGGWGSSSSPVGSRDRTFLRSVMRRQVERAVLHLT
jgi:hypothetical protein